MTEVANKRKRGGGATGTDSRAAAVVGDPPLGIVTKTSSPFPTGPNLVHFPVVETGEILFFNQQNNGSLTLAKLPAQARAERWALKSVVNKIMPESRTSKCMVLRAPIPGVGLSPIQVHKTSEHGKAFYTGLLSCGSVWNCPVCAAKVSERRRQELKQAMSAAKRLGWQAHFVTLTVPHGIGDDLSQIRALQQKALQRLSSGKNAIKSQLESRGISQHGYVRAYEITHGQNGFHPHFHIILFTSAASSDLIHSLYAPAWRKACVSVGLPEPSLKHGCTVQDGSYASEYASKWGIEDEMTKANQKQSKRKGVSPWGLLRAALDGDNSDYPPDRAISLFRVYSGCMTGARQLYWSNGLRAKLALSTEMTDEQLAEKITDETSRHIASITMEQWRPILKNKAEANILAAIESLPEGADKLIGQQIINGYLEREQAKAGKGPPWGMGTA